MKNADFGTSGASLFSARVGTTHNGGVTLEIRLDKPDGPLAGTLKIPMTGGNDRWALTDLKLDQKIKGLHDVYFVIRGKAAINLMYFDYWRFLK
ncbi:carbohydrate-binding protein [Niabella hibiscisoli]|uniref:carbohydrate-binding protein n=1 Tax=Niabella hibiscisoli TaxID=1825928 RepID=UPI001F0E09EC|nr:carbohydrate-binding protein [Niabella hibiscisoli]MCH5719456.1 carbohydrate-binding protein [Niabella hibiscisoli]